MNDSLQKIVIGASGITASGVTEVATAINPEDITNGASLVVQILIAIVTLFGLFKKKTPKTE